MLTPRDNISFQTPESELFGKLQSTHPRPNSLVGAEVEEFLRLRTASQFRPLSWVNGDFPDYGAWKARVLPMLAAKLKIAEVESHPLDACLENTVETEDYIEEEIEFTVTAPMRTKAFVVKPRRAGPPFPAVIGLHCMGGLRAFGREKLLSRPGEPEYLRQYREQYYGGRSLGRELARKGYLAIMIDAFHFGSRTNDAKENFARFAQERHGFTEDESAAYSARVNTEDAIAARALLGVGCAYAGITVTDDLRTVDYLLTRPDVDVSRIGCVGLSLGSFRANYLTALDSRITAGVSVCWHSSFAGLLGYNLPDSLGWFALPLDVYNEIDLPDIACLAAPKPFLAISGWQDGLMQPFGIAQAHLAMRRAYRAAGAEDRLGSLCFNAPHEFNAEMQEAAFAFFEHHLRPDGRG